MAAAASAAPGQSDPAGVAAFAARGENWGGTLLALAGTGGIWNAQAVPVSRTTVVAPLFTLGLLVAAIAGFGTLRRRWPAGFANRLALLAGGTLLLAAAGALPGTSALLRAAVTDVPGAGLLRDGQKFLIPYALCLALCAALAAEQLADRLSTRVSAAAGRLVLVGAALLPVAMLPDLAWGVGGKLRPVPYPADWAAVGREVAAAPGPVVSLPMSAYRSYPWNPGAPVLDPAARYLPAPVLTDDRLRVGDLVIAGESRAAAAIRDRLAAGRPVADAGVRWVLLQRDTVPPAALTGLVPVVRGPDLQLYRNPDYRPSDAAAPSPLGYLLAAAVFGGALCRRGGAWRAARAGTGRGRGQPAAQQHNGRPEATTDTDTSKPERGR